MECYQWLILYLVQETDKKQNEVINAGADKFTARNESQVYRAAVLSRAYGEYTALRYYWSQVSTAEPSLQAPLNSVGCLYGLSCLDKHLVYFYQGGYASGPEMSQNVKDSILALCKILKSDSLAIIDGMAPPDYVVNSVLGRSDGKVSYCFIFNSYDISIVICTILSVLSNFLERLSGFLCV